MRTRIGPNIHNIILGQRRLGGLEAVTDTRDTRYKIQETLFNVDFQEYNLITLAMSYFVDKHDMKNCTSIHILTKITD